MVKIANSVLELIGETPLVKLNYLVDGDDADVYVKLESFNVGGSVKDRIALNMIEVAEEEGVLQPGGTIIEATSGNTGIGLALVGAAKGYKVIIVMPETMSIERRQLMAAYGAEIVLTSGPGGMPEAIQKAESILAETDNGFIPSQFENLANPAVHEVTTGPEIIEALGFVPDAFIAGVGTGGTITGVGRAMKKIDSNIKIYAVEPEESPVLSGGEKGPHQIQGLGAGFVPHILDTTLYDEIITVNSPGAKKTARDLARLEGILVGISSGAAIAGAVEVAKRLGKGHTVVVVAPDNGERYLSTDTFNQE